MLSTIRDYIRSEVELDFKEHQQQQQKQISCSDYLLNLVSSGMYHSSNTNGSTQTSANMNEKVDQVDPKMTYIGFRNTVSMPKVLGGYQVQNIAKWTDFSDRKRTEGLDWRERYTLSVCEEGSL